VRPADDGTACDDGDPCTESDACTLGACAGLPRACAELDGPCTVGQCAADGSCRAVARPDLTPCDDGSLCTANEACLGGLCVGTQPDCSELDGPCRAGTCNPETGRCEAAPGREGEACDDADACTANDACAGGECSGARVDCGALDGPCLEGRCDSESGACVAAVVREAEACDDGNACTEADTCHDGECQGRGEDCSDLTGPCTVGQCDADGECAAVPVPEGTPCVTEDLCQIGGACMAGECVTEARDCSDLDTACTRGVCDPRNGACVSETLPNDTPCDDGSVCSERDACYQGRCEGRPKDCRMFDAACTQGACDPALPGGCYARPVVDGIPCESGNLCQVEEVCRGGRCAGLPKDCPAPAAGSCRVTTCNPDTGACGFADAADGAACDDGRYCTVNDRCQGGSCGGGARDCNPPGETCRVGACDEANDRCNVSDRPDGTQCDDGQYCTTDDRCSRGVCRPRAWRSCPDANAGCRVGECDEGNDRCGFRDASDLKPCSDGDLCTLNHCDDGQCVVFGRVCN
jgi:hypothetical protein